MPEENHSRRGLLQLQMMGLEARWDLPWRAWGLVGMVLLLSACTDPLVGRECAQGFEPCGNRCAPMGTCESSDGGVDVEGSDDAGTGVDAEELEAAASEDALDAEESVVDAEAPSLDAEEPMDTGLDAEEAAPVLDAGRDKSVAKPDAKADAKPDVRDSGSPDLDTARDLAPQPDLRDAAPDKAPDAPLPGGDVPLMGGDALDVPLANDTGPVLMEDAAWLDGPCVGCGDGGDAKDAAPDAPPDAHGPEPGPEAGPETGDTRDSPSVDTRDASSDPALDCPDALSACSGQCVDYSSDPQNCGKCGTVCATGICRSGVCLVCKSHETLCTDRCLNLHADRENCGGCGTACLEGLCSDGECEAADLGHVVVIGHDFTSRRLQMDYILGNAVFLLPGDPVRLLAFEGEADPAAVALANSGIAARATAKGRTFERTVTTASQLPTALETSDVLLIHGQTNASNATLTDLAQDWSAALTAFVGSGGTVILLDGVYAGNSGTYQILVEADLFGATARTSATNAVCKIASPGHVLISELAQDYICVANSVRFTTSDEVSVVETADESVVVYKTF